MIKYDWIRSNRKTMSIQNKKDEEKAYQSGLYVILKVHNIEHLVIARCFSEYINSI